MRNLGWGLLMGFAAVSSTAYAGDAFVGAGIYAERCANCHGANGRGELPGTPNFTAPELRVKTDNDFKAVILNGRNVMPAFQGILKDEEIDDVIAHIRTFF